MSVSDSDAHVMGKVISVKSKRRMVPGHDKRASAALGGGPHGVGGVTPSASDSERVPGPSTCSNVGGGGRGEGAEPLRGHGAEPRLVSKRTTRRGCACETSDLYLLHNNKTRETTFEKIGGNSSQAAPPHSGRGPATEDCLGRAYDPFEGVPSRLGRTIDACLNGKWHLRFVDRRNQEEWRTPFRCKSWRCPKCGGKIARRDYLRTKKAFDRYDSWAFCVLTLDVKSWKYRGKKNTDAYKVINHLLEKLRRRMERKYGPVTYIRVIERTPKNSFPHVNFVFHCQGLFDLFPTDEAIGKWNKRWLTGNAKGCGFGIKHTVDYARNKKMVASYLAKTGLFSVIAKEISKQSQIPFDAPPGFRRLGATRGLLEPIKKQGNFICGELIKSPLNIESKEEEISHGRKEATG